MTRYISFIIFVWFISGCSPQPSFPSSHDTKKCLSTQQLNAYAYEHLSRVAKQLREEKKNIDAFDVVMLVMKRTMDEYSEMLKSSVAISNVARFLPIPYAGEVCNTTKLVSKMALNIGNAATALHKYKASSEEFLVGFDKLNRTTATTAELSKLAVYADTVLLNNAKNLEFSLKEISASTNTLVATTQSMTDALETTSGYMNQAKTFVGFGSEISAEEKNKVVQNRNSIHERLVQLNQRIVILEKSGQGYRYNIAKARVYSELASGMESFSEQ